MAIKIDLISLRNASILIEGLDVRVSSKHFHESDIGWPPKPPTGNVLKFKLIFHDSTKILFVFKHQNKAKLKTLNDFGDLNSDFSDLRTSAASMTSTASTTSVASMTSTASFHQIFH